MDERKIELKRFLQLMLMRNASDLYFKVGSPPQIRTAQGLEKISKEEISSSDMETLILPIIDEEKLERFRKEKEMDLAYDLEGVGRFRINLFFQKGKIGMVIREVKKQIPNFEELNLPSEALQKLSMEARGIVLVTGPAGSGKSTTLAAMIDYINQNKHSHIVTIEDPIEFLHEDKKSLINQRQVGIDTNSFFQALKYVVRQAPDVILIGEIRDLKTAEVAIMAAETGHLVLSTLHTIDAPRTIERIINFFPPYYQPQLRVQLAHILKGVVSLRLLTGKDDRRIPAVAIMIHTPTVQKLIMEGRLDEIKDVMEEGEIFGMQTFSQALLKLYNEGKISCEVALKMSDSPHEFELKVKGILKGSGR